MTEPPLPPPGQWQQPPPGWGPPPPGYGSGYYPPPATDSKAIIALVCAIGAWVICPIVPAIVALVLAGSSQRDIAASGGRLQGQGLVTAARVVAWANIVIAGLVILLFFLFVAAVPST